LDKLKQNRKTMEITAAVLYGGSLAHYDVQVESGRECFARLSSYNGNPSQQPPHTITLRKEGRHWVSDSADNNLSDDLGYAVELKAKPILEGRRRDGSHPAG
jgi:hypothetical protein